MNIVYFLHDTNSKCGASKAVLNLIEQLKMKGDKAYVVLPNKHDIYIELLQAGIPCFVTPYRNAIYPTKRSITDKIKYPIRLLYGYMINKIAARKITKFLIDKQIDIIHSNTSVIDVGYKVAKNLECCHIYHIREFVKEYNNTSYFPSDKTFQRRLQKADRYSYSACIIPDLQQTFGIAETTYSTVIYDGVLPQKKELTRPEKKGYLLYIGRVEYQKGLLELINGYVDYLKRSKIKLPLTVLGSINQQDYFDIIQETLQSNSIMDKVTFCGMQSDVHKYLESANAIVVSSLSEGFGFCMAEAMFDECLVIGYDKCRGTHQQFENGRALTGSEIGYRYNNKDELVEALLKADTLNNEIMIENAWKTVNTMYTNERNFNSTYQFYKYVLENEKTN